MLLRYPTNALMSDKYALLIIINDKVATIKCPIMDNKLNNTELLDFYMVFNAEQIELECAFLIRTMINRNDICDLITKVLICNKQYASNSTFAIASLGNDEYELLIRGVTFKLNSDNLTKVLLISGIKEQILNMSYMFRTKYFQNDDVSALIYKAIKETCEEVA